DDAARAAARVRRQGAAHRTGGGRVREADHRSAEHHQQHRRSRLVGPGNAAPGRSPHVAHRRPAERPAAGADTASAATRRRARAQARSRTARPDGPEDLGLTVRCLQWTIAGPPMLPGVYNNNVQFVQTRDTIAIVNEMIHDARIVPMDGRPHGAMRRWMGDSRGRWENGTLVVDPLNLSGKDEFR